MTLAAEFPNDNPDLHEGTIWVCLDVTGLPVAERRPVPAPPAIVRPVEVEEEEQPTAASPPPRESGIFMVVDSFSSLRDEDEGEDDEEIVVEELAPLEDAVVEVVEPISVEVVAVAEEAAVVAEEPIVFAAEPIVVAEESVVAVEPEPFVAPVVTLAPPPPDDPYVAFMATLVDIAIAHGAAAAAGDLPAALASDPIAQAWAGILRGTSEDWDAIGGSMLDEWAADTLARATGADAATLKRELRQRGVAAFGLAA